MKKALLALTVLSCTIPMTARELMCEQCECEPEPCCPEHLFVERSQWYVNAEFLYWTAESGAIDYAVRASETPPNSAVFATGDYKTADYDWSPGFRVGLAYYRCPKYWEVNAEYTWFYTKGTDSTSSDFVRPTRLTNAFGPFTSADSTIYLHYHVGDVYADRVFDPNPHLRLRLIGGLTTAYIKQDWKINYTNAQNVSEKVTEEWRYFGGGIRMGMRADWFWGCQFYLTGKTTFATLIGTYKNEEVQTNPNTDTLFGNAKYDDHRFAVHGQFLLGPSWQIPCDCWSFELLAAYEFNTWINLHERIRSFQATFNDDSTETYYARGLFGTHGLTLRLNLGF
ncbi:MAG: Lpg1974 family pore-forming outer membrane protein [Simkaniaceae bacterium]|nr:Lpg1974 family pore-forming outer membrane protein [Candidatus Sacchlamyda saccharinae]